jgi:hypothetical protein
MKVSPDAYAHMKGQIALIGAEKAAAHRQFILNEGKAKDVEKRLRWDLSYYAQLTLFLCDTIYPSGCDDTHVDTALRAIMRDLGYTKH